MEQRIDLVLRALHSRIADGEEIVELHSADIAAIIACVQSLSKRLSVVEKLLASHCGCEVEGLHDIATESDIALPGD